MTHLKVLEKNEKLSHFINLGFLSLLLVNLAKALSMLLIF